MIFDMDQTGIGLRHQVIPVKNNGIGKHSVDSNGLHRRKAWCSSHNFSNLPLAVTLAKPGRQFDPRLDNRTSAARRPAIKITVLLSVCLSEIAH